MSNIAKALIWAVAMILLAIGKRYGVVDAKAADTMFVIIPILALMSIINRRNCLPRRGDKSAAQ